jgi:hypothetical protein
MQLRYSSIQLTEILYNLREDRNNFKERGPYNMRRLYNETCDRLDALIDNLMQYTAPQAINVKCEDEKPTGDLNV